MTGGESAGQEWSAEVVVDAPLARRLIADQFPAVELGSLELLAEGWDNTVWVADARWAFRFPRRTVAIPGVRRELAVLPRLAPLLPVPVPVPELVGRPGHGFPWPFFGAPLLPGREVADANWGDRERARLAVPLAEFLRTLHSAATLAAVDPEVTLPADANQRADMRLRAPWTRERLLELERLGLWRAPAAVGRLLDAAEDLPPAEPTALAHGDLHVRHLLVGEDGAMTGVIDWGDVCRADPAIDLMLLWSLLPPAARDGFLDAYGPVAPDQARRARVLALFLCGTLALYAHHEGLPALEREALGGLARATT
jgi:aminoglycoside phosphotransferase (APT) family kinase protein